MSGSGFYSVALGAIPDTDFCGRARIKVERKGRYHPVYLLTLNGEELATLRWEGPRRIRYNVVGSGEHYDMKVGTMQRKIRAVDDDGRVSRILVSSNHNLDRRDMRLQLRGGDNFILKRKVADRWGNTRFEIRKQHYLNPVLVFHFNRQDVSSQVLIDVERLMRWEILNFHLLLALVTARIGLEHRMNGTY
jgi:hypothetical protein